MKNLKNKKRYSIINYLKKFNDYKNKDLRGLTYNKLFAELSNTIYKKYQARKIIEALKKYIKRKQQAELLKLQEENKILKNKIENQSKNNNNYYYDNQLMKLQKENFELTQTNLNLKYKIDEQKKQLNLLSKKTANINNSNTDVNDLKVIKEFKTDIPDRKKYDYPKSLSIRKLKKHLINNKIDAENKSQHQLKQQYNQLANRKFVRVVDKIINLH